MKVLRICTAFLIFATAVCGQYSNPSPTSDKKLTIEYVANEGVMITHGGDRILIDAIHRNYKPQYAFTPDEMLSKIENARFPFGDKTLVLVSHNHLDHFHAGSVANHLINNPNAKLVSSGQVVDEVSAEIDMLSKQNAKVSFSEDQIVKIAHEWKKSEEITVGGIKIKFLSFLHANSKIEAYRKIQNFGHLIEIGGKKLLHIGDADMFAENFSEFKLNEEKIDVVLLPYWFVQSKTGRDIINNYLRAKATIAVHVPPKNESSTIRDILGSMPSAIVFSEPGEMLNY